MIKELYVVNSDGVVIDTIDSKDNYIKLSVGDKVIRNGTIKYLEDTKDIKYSFVKVNPFAWKQIAIKYPIINTLIYYLGYMDGILQYKNGKNVQMKDISKICGVSESTAKRQISMLIKKDIIHKVKGKKTIYLKLNPYIATIGKRITKELYDEFKMSEWKNQCEELKGKGT